MSAVQSKHFLNGSSSLVLESLQGLCLLDPTLALDAKNKIVYKKSRDQNKVALLCGGGSGHEPAHAGFVGDGILTGAVCGNVFASPSANQVRRAIELVDNNAGTVIIVKNYTGDVLNFGLAKEQYAALHPEKSNQVRFIIVGDDVAVGKSQGKIVGRRGLAGTVIVYKLAGALAQRGGTLDQVCEVAEWAAANLATIGVSLEHTHVPGTAASSSELSGSEIEIGMGIHNESGNQRVSPIPPLSELIPRLFDLLTSTTDPERSFVPFRGQDSVAVLVNNLGGVSELELGSIANQVVHTAKSRGFNVKRLLTGTFMTSLNMPGFSITLLLLPAVDSSAVISESNILGLLDETPRAAGWKWSSTTPPTLDLSAPAEVPVTIKTSGIKYPDPSAFNIGIKQACEALATAEPEITRMDSIAGDGDCGLTLKAGAEGVLSRLSTKDIDGIDVVKTMITIAQVAEETMGGTSGALYSIFFSALAQGLQAQNNLVATPEAFSAALTSALAKLYTYTRARPPSRTLVDPLAAFIETLAQDPANNFAKAVVSAGEAAEETQNLVAKAGRSAYVEGDRLKEQKIPDPGAWGVKTILEHLSS